MKKFVAILLSSIMLITVPVMADVPDISGLTDEEIVELNNLVNQSLMNRGIRKTASLNPGKYVVGSDIPVGKYELYCKYDGEWWASYYINDADGNEIESGSLFGPDNKTASNKGETAWFITLNEGWTLEISNPMTLTIASTVTFQ